MSLSEQDAKSFWTRLRKQQIKEGVRNLKKICAKEGLSYQTLINQKCTNRYPTVPIIVVLAKELNCSIDWLLTGEEHDNTGLVAYYSKNIQNAIDILQQLN